jgi:uncharacterized protein GlcG (DUF336 family)
MKKEEGRMNRHAYSAVVCFLCVAVSIGFRPAGGDAQEQAEKPKGLTLEVAERFLAAAKDKAQKEGWAMSVAIVDVAGYPIALARMDGARWLTAEVAQSKAFTAVTFRRPSAAVEELAKTRPQLFSSIASLVGRPLLLAGGGLPLIIGGELLGGVGASGGTEEQDVECARAGLAAIGAE